MIGTEYAIGDQLPQFWTDIATGKKADEAQRIAWQARDRATEMEKRQKSVKTSPDLDQLVETLKNRRLKLSPAQRVGFDAWLLNAIR